MSDRDRGVFSKEDRQWLRDMKREAMKEVTTSEDPAYKRTMCKCGHRMGQHYMGNMAMPCGKCHCGHCECEAAETIRRDKKRKGVQDMSPHPEFRGKM
jgi:hypothetical protein